MTIAGIVSYKVRPNGTLEGQWTHRVTGGKMATEIATGGTPGKLEGTYRVELNGPDGLPTFAGTLEISRLGEAYLLTWTGYQSRPERSPVRFTGIGATGPGDTFVATFQEDQSPASARFREVWDRIPAANGDRFADAFRHGTLRVLVYAPQKTDPQQPHEQDEVYVVMKGSGSFVLAGSKRPFAAGDVLLIVPANTKHQFVDFTDDLALWVVFYGPIGGEFAWDPRPEIEKANADFGTAFAAGDAEAIAAMYTDKARLLPPNSPAIDGRVAIQQFWKTVMASGIKKLVLVTAEVESFGDTVIESGAATLYNAAGALADRGKYLVVWKRAGGRWLLHRDCWNSNDIPKTK